MVGDIVIIGAGMGGCAFLSRFAGSGLRVLIAERGPFIPTEKENWEAEAVAAQGRYENDAEWETPQGEKFHPRIYYCVGGSSKFFGASAFRLRSSDFHARQIDGVKAPPWPISYDDLSPWYDEAERAMQVHGLAGSDPSEPPRGDFPHPPLEHEAAIARTAALLERQGLHPFPLPIAVHQGPGGRCRKGSPCDGFPCRIRAKGDAENAFLRPALKADKNLTLLTHTRIDRLEHDKSGRHVVCAHGTDARGNPIRLQGSIFVLAAGAAESALLLLRSKTPLHPNGLANGSGLVGRCFMAHNNSVLMAIHPLRRNSTRFQKTLALHDFYHSGNPSAPAAAGGIQTRGKILPVNLRHHPRFPVRLLRHPIACRSVDFWLMSEDAPCEENRLELTENYRVILHRRESNMQAHIELVQHFRRILRSCGFPIVLVQKPRLGAVQHQCGTLRFGTDPRDSVFNRDCRSHQLDNLYCCDASVFPSSAAVNPALSIAANALRVGTLCAQSKVRKFVV